MFIFSENKSQNEKPQGTHQDDDHQERARRKRGSTNRSSKRPPRDGGNNTVGHVSSFPCINVNEYRY
jgi:hypothetical protein